MIKQTIVLALVIVICSCGMNPFQLKQSQEYMEKLHAKKVEDPQKDIKVHVNCHTHDDVGWLKTVDLYYYGGNQNVQWAGVQYTIDTVIKELQKDPRRKFIYVEMAFFWRWWREQDEKQQQIVKQLVKNGQFQFINAGWCMNDEAAAYYEDIIDQMTLGHQFILDHFNYVPNIGWHIDPFGHQNAQASLFSQMGFDSFMFGRIDYQDKDNRLRQKAMQFFWDPKQASQLDTSILGIILYNQYQPPGGFCFDQFCNDEPIMDDPSLEGYNLDRKAQDFHDYFQSMASHYRSKVLQHTFGSDFQYANALLWYKNLDKLIDHINGNPEKYNNMTFQYSTPQDFINELKDQNIKFPKNTEDLMPYADGPDNYWTGYFTSRIADKGQVKHIGRFYQSLRNYVGMLRLRNESSYTYAHQNQIDTALFVMEEGMGILQHHDAVSGTAKQYVQNDYYYMKSFSKLQFFSHRKSYFMKKTLHILSNATQTLVQELNGLLQEQTEQVIEEDISNFEFCLWNMTSDNCPTSYNQLKADKPVLMTVYNPSFLNNYQNFKIEIPNVLVDVYDADNKAITSDIFCLNETDANDCHLYFGAELIDYQINYFKIVPTKFSTTTSFVKPHIPANSLNYDIRLSENKYLNTQIKAGQTFFTYKDCEGQDCGFKATFQINYNYYKSFQDDGQKSGAYIFRPDNTDTFNHSIPYSKILKQTVYQGQTVTIQHLEGQYTDTQVKYYTQYAQDEYIEIETFIDSIPINDKQGKEIVLLVQTDIDNGDIFYTDSNGLEMQRRKLNYRDTWDLEVHQPAAGNYYPINAAISIEDKTLKATLLNDRAQGGTSLQNGQMELMIHRRLVKDDSRGVGEPLNETNQWNTDGLQQRVRHYLVFDNPGNLKFRSLQQEFDQFPVIFFSETKLDKFAKNHDKQPLIDSSFPHYVKVYIRYLKDKDSYILRFHNMNEQRTLYVNFGQVGFINFDSEEMTLTANQKKSVWDKKRIQWNHDGKEEKQKEKEVEIDLEVQENGSNQDIMLRPLQFRTYMMKAQKSMKISE